MLVLVLVFQCHNLLLLYHIWWAQPRASATYDLGGPWGRLENGAWDGMGEGRVKAIAT